MQPETNISELKSERNMSNPFGEAQPSRSDKAKIDTNPFAKAKVDTEDLENPFEDRGFNPFTETKSDPVVKDTNPFGDAANVNTADLENPFEDRGPNPFADEPTIDQASVNDAVKDTMSADASDAVADNKFTELRDPYKEAAAAAEKDTSGPEMG